MYYLLVNYSNMIFFGDMTRDNRYNVVRILLEKGEIKTIIQIFQYIPKSVVSQELRTNNNRFSLLVKDPHRFKIKELVKIADAIGIEPEVLVLMALHGQKRKARPARKSKK